MNLNLTNMKLAQFKSYYYKKKFNRNKFISNLSTIKSANYYKNINNNKLTTPLTQRITSTKSLVRPFKHLGPDPLPARPVKFHKEDNELKKVQYKNLCYNNEDLYINRDPDATFALNDFLIKYEYQRGQRSGLSPKNISKKAQISTHNYKQICQLLSQRLNEKKDCLLNIQTLVPDIEMFQNRRPMRQEMIELAHNLKKDISHSLFDKFFFFLLLLLFI